MPKNSSAAARRFKDPKLVVRVILGVLVAANLVAAGMVLFPPGGSAEDLERQMASLQARVTQNKALLQQTRQHAAAVQKGKADGDKFLDEYFLDRRTGAESLNTALNQAVAASKIKLRNASFNIQPIEGSDTLSMVTITTDFEGSYQDVLRFVHEIDKSDQLLIVDSLSATPQQGSSTLAVQMKLDAFMKESAAQ